MSEIIDCISFIVRKLCWSLAVFFKFLLLRFVDLLGLFFNILACATLVRLPFMIAQFANMDSIMDFRYVGLVQFLIFLMDIPIFIMGVIILLTLWRIYPCISEIKEEWKGKFKYAEIYFTGFKVRKVIVKHFFTLFIDAFCVPSAIICLLSWRSILFVKRFRKADGDWKKRKVCFLEFMQVVLDIPLIICLVITTFSWRLPVVIYKVDKYRSKSNSWDEYIRFIGLQQLFLLFTDIPFLLMAIVTVLTWRSFCMIKKLKTVKGSYFKRKNQWKVGKIVSVEFISIFADIPCIVAIFVIIITIWRLPQTLRRFKKAKEKGYLNNSTQNKIRSICLIEFGIMLIDALCFLLFVVEILTIWRAYPLFKDMQKYIKKYRTSRKKQRIFNSKEIDNQSNCSRNESADTLNEGTTDNGQIEIKEECESSETLNQTIITKNETENRIRKNLTSTSELDEARDSVTIEFSKTKDDVTAPEATIVISTDISEDEDIPHFSYSKLEWKLRKSISMNFFMLVIDIPAIVLFFVLLVTLLRASKTISAVLGGGNFHLLFAITVYHQTTLFLIDLTFLILFFILCIKHPVRVWVMLLEDEEHEKNRILREDIMPWVPDMLKDRNNMYKELEDILSLSIKEVTPQHEAKRMLTDHFEQYLDRVQGVIDKLNDNGIEEEVTYQLKSILYYENSRVHKMMRKYRVEVAFLQRPDVKLHKDNVFRLAREVREYNETVNTFYNNLEKYKVEKLPLYEERSGLSLRTRDETKKVLIKCLLYSNFLVFGMMLFALIPLYRFHIMVYQLFGRWYNRFAIVTSTLREYLLDFLTILQILLVLILLYRAPFLLVDILDCVIERRSWKAVRNVVKKYPPAILEDILLLASNIFSWNTPRLVFTTILFVVFIPADLYINIVKICVQAKFFIYTLTLILYLFFIGTPIVITTYAAKELIAIDLGWTNIVLMCVFDILLFFTLTLMVFTLAYDKSRDYSLEVPRCDYIRYNWYNLHVVLFELLELLQTLALAFSIRDVPLFGGTTLHKISGFLLFSFMPFEVKFWLTFTAIVIWFFVCGTPIIFENILETHPMGTFSKRSSFRLLVSLFANTLFVTLVENLISFTSCDYFEGGRNLTQVSGNSTSNITSSFSKLVEDDSISCWQGAHVGYALFGLIGLVWYCTTSLIFSTRFGDPEASDQDIGFSSIYNTILNIFKAVMVLSVSLITNNNYVAISVYLVFSIIAVVFTMFFRSIFKHSATNVPSVIVFRTFTFMSCIVGAISIIIALSLDDIQTKVPILILGVGVLVTLIISIIVAIKLNRESEVEKDRTQFRLELIKLERNVKENHWLVDGWEKQTHTWKRLSKSVREASKEDRDVDPSNWDVGNFNTDSIAPPPFESDIPPPSVSSPPNDLMPSNYPNVLLEPPLSIDQTPMTPLEQLPDENVSVVVSNTKISSKDLTWNTLSNEKSQPDSNIEENVDGTSGLEGESNLRNYHEDQVPIQRQYVRIIDGITELKYEITKLDKNGRNLLLMFEKHIHYHAYKYSFLSQRNIWINSVWKSNWSGLLHCLQILRSNLNGSFNEPSHLDIQLSPGSMPCDKLTDDTFVNSDPPPERCRKLTKQEKSELSAQIRLKVLDDFKNHDHHGNEWNELFGKLLPVGSSLYAWNYSADGSFELLCRRRNTGVIKEIDESGNKLAVGASFTIGKKLRGNITGNNLYFDKGFAVSAKKGPVSIVLDDLMFTEKGGNLYISGNGRKVKFSVAIASCKTIQWR